MYCQNKITHTVQEGDSLYKLSRQYRTTVTELILGNPGVNPYNLQVGMKLLVCPGPEYEMPAEDAVPNPSQLQMGENTTADAMRLAWLNHVFWTRMYLMSASVDAPDQKAVENRLLQTADEITSVFATSFPVNVIRQLRNLLLEHIEIAGQIIAALKSGDMTNYDALIKSWYANANQIAELLGQQNPYFAGRETRNMMLNHLDLLREEIEAQLNGEYEKSIDIFRDIENQAIEMADFFARGLMAR